MSSVWHHFQAGGWAMYLILFWLVCSIAIIAERTVYLVGASINKDVFLVKPCKSASWLATSPRPLRCALPRTRPSRASFRPVWSRSIAPTKRFRRRWMRQLLKAMPKINKRTGFLVLFANLAMLCGLFGTIVGLIKAFGAVGGESIDPSQKARILAEGISEAMNCTAFGLISAIIALMGFAFLNGKTQGMEDDINEASVSVLNLVVANRQKVNLQGVETAAE
ncbi:MAG: MotA/TolQ/ExbB proton channel family protein [Polyangiaceae bacterium]